MLDRRARRPDAVERYGDGPLHIVDRYGPPDPGRPTALLVHGGFWRSRYDRVHLRSLAAGLADEGWTALLAEYARVGHRGGGWPGTLTDVRAAIAWAADRVEGLVVAGHSAGGHLAVRALAELDAPATVARVVSLAGVLDLEAASRDGLGGDAVGALLDRRAPGFAMRLADADPLRRTTPTASVVLLHGTADDNVPVGQSRAYAAAHPSARLIELPGAGHYELIDPEAAEFPAVLAALGGARDTPHAAG